MPQVPETAVHGGFSLTVEHFISEMTDSPQQYGTPKNRLRRPAQTQARSHKAAVRIDSPDTYTQLFIVLRLRIPELIIDSSLIRNQLLMLPPMYNLSFVKHRNLVAEAAEDSRWLM